MAKLSSFALVSPLTRVPASRIFARSQVRTSSRSSPARPGRTNSVKDVETFPPLGDMETGAWALWVWKFP